MAKDKERSVNPAQQARRQEKNRALKKAKNEQQARRNERLVRRNPDRIQAQINDLKALESSGEIKPREKAVLADLERDLRAVYKAREALGENAPAFGSGRPRVDRAGDGSSRGGGILGKRGRDGERRNNVHHGEQDSDSGGDTDETVRAIPMPRDTPPPIPYEFRRRNQQRYGHHNNTGADAQDPSIPQPPAPAIEHKATYSSAPQLRDLRKEATSRFVPSAVKRKQDAVKGVGGGLLEPEELDRLEAAGYYKAQGRDKAIGQGDGEDVLAVSNVDAAEARRLAEEEANFERELALDDDTGFDAKLGARCTVLSNPTASHQVQIEEVEDEDL